MNETPSTPSGERPEGRYGSRTRRRPRWVVGVSLGVAAGLGLVASVVAYNNFGPAPIQAQQTAFDITSDAGLDLSFEVVRDEPERAAVCVVASRAENGDEVGRREVFVPPGEGTQIYTTTLRTSQPPVIGEVFGCSYDVPEYLVDTVVTPPEGGMRPSG
ncbi:DUF4307 domain-containing protein [Actinoalloteichus hymeniacidonis]|uniref:DUF4307 family protein n=1 Tax=Actinoalloteichus hymeniacidonis TaxID=340345 RepID=A0AAC9HMN5_9PSEU|nr:DUF4307 domain-containing protein [Actinoalloteichus hymeniacidonis]AOS61640.1 putative DUF4307 family protein [Actinoalloteichus hymeniacidonis]MBB5910347.1 hypothetical protein [Actinoalloteichus hymeniacidonis]